VWHATEITEEHIWLLWEKLKEKRGLGGPTRRYEDNIKMDIKEI
jgi:hypothetical protein